jgi:hypothetical protein
MADEKSRAEYQAAYWLDNKKKLSEKKAQRYANDPGYRTAIADSAERRRIKKAKERKRLIAEGKIPPRRKKRKPRSKVEVNGELKFAFRLKEAARRLGKSKENMFYLIRKGVLPATPFVLSRSFLYTDEMIRVMQTALEKREKGDIPIDDSIHGKGDRILARDKKIRQMIVDGWAEAGVTVE